MRLATVAQTKEIDLAAQRADGRGAGLSSEALMEAAGALAARELTQAFPAAVKDAAGPRLRVVVVCGPGGNGADGLVAARHLRAAGIPGVVAVLVAHETKRSPLFRKQLERARLAQVEIRDALVDDQGAWLAVRDARLAVDALFGAGLNGAIREPYARAVAALNARREPVASLDAPSGLDCDRGMPAGGADSPAVRAGLTICFGLARPGFFLSEGPRHVGRLLRISIGVPQALARAIATTTFAFGGPEAARCLPGRSAVSNKSTHGRALIMAGHDRMWGAGLLASASALRSGAGYVTWASWTNPMRELAALPEALTAAIDDELLAKAWGGVAIGPGLGTEERTAETLHMLKARGHERVVVDADALTAAARFGAFPFPATWVATPHAGELGRILGTDASEIESDRLRYAEEGARVLGCHVLLKGFRTVIVAPVKAGGRRTVILSGNSALAKAGTGDVLAGAIAGLMAQGLAPEAAACLGAYAHGRVADEWVKAGRGRGTLLASDVADLLPAALASIARGKRAGGREGDGARA